MYLALARFLFNRKLTLLLTEMRLRKNLRKNILAVPIMVLCFCWIDFLYVIGNFCAGTSTPSPAQKHVKSRNPLIINTLPHLLNFFITASESTSYTYLKINIVLNLHPFLGPFSGLTIFCGYLVGLWVWAARIERDQARRLFVLQLVSKYGLFISNFQM